MRSRCFRNWFRFGVRTFFLGSHILNYTVSQGILLVMATKNSKKTRKAAPKKSVSVKAEKPVWVEQPVVMSATETSDTSDLDPQEEKMLDWILKGVVTFVLAWLGLSVLLVIGGLFKLWG